MWIGKRREQPEGQPAPLTTCYADCELNADGTCKGREPKLNPAACFTGRGGNDTAPDAGTGR